MERKELLKFGLSDMIKISLIVIAVLYMSGTVKCVRAESGMKIRENIKGINNLFDETCITAPTQEEIHFIEVKEGKEKAAIERKPQMCFRLTDEEFDLLSRLTAAEAEGEGFEAQYAIACVIMNRVRSESFPDSISEVIWQEEPVRQFSSMWNGRYERCNVTDSCYEAVQYMVEYGNELPEDVLYFTSCGYLPNTDPYMQIGNMFFSRQKRTE